MILSHSAVTYLHRWHTRRHAGAFPGRKHTINLLGPARQRSKRGPRGGVAPWLRPPRHRRRPWGNVADGSSVVTQQITGQVTITWTASLSLALFSSWFLSLSRLHLQSHRQAFYPERQITITWFTFTALGEWLLYEWKLWKIGFIRNVILQPFHNLIFGEGILQSISALMLVF